MSELSYLEKLLDGVEVEWKTLGSIAELKRGTSITKKDVIDGTIPVVAGGRTPAYYHNTSNRDGQTIVIAGSGAYAGFVSWWEEPIFVSDAFTVKPHNILLPRYCYHFLMNMQQQLHDFKSGGGVPHVYPRDVSPILIPIPCPDNPEKSLAIQSEIVRILDKFTALTAELTAELNMRKKQYNYYRDRLFSFGAHDVKRLKLGELCVIGDGLHGTPEYDANGDYFFINGNNLGYQKISFNDNTKKVNDSMFKKHGIHFDPINTVFLSINGTIGNVSFYNNEKIVLGKSVAYFKIKSPELHTRYLFYFLQTNYAKQYFENQKTGSTIKNLGLKSLRAFEIPIPSYDEQLYIVATMDKFYNLTNSITEGLPREIELRQKQYEYYRDLLFSFPKPETVSN
ncbi:TPA: restriction endonuclease subunit S [Escherichia coli]|uniref:restriction endonuclease subunit S n=1 Tax=Enterobacteriaceae TaxID=543 RepID=UPI000BB65971|nr:MULTISPECIES: restriction endonuclease subunit S [Enterobacteriaceae]ELS6811615.1 restriction endonuclease subunit S [Salmonella enterica]ELT4763731.1 restriction endonuclease subunit S [Salmonella enterica]MBM0920971.1 restriction endonuclease subunit S [Escherichia coli]MCA7069357.1 restriction endonuclease subunit S [Escherichia coli]MCH6658432.1 restriction endonuclease [Escherichia coli]